MKIANLTLLRSQKSQRVKIKPHMSNDKNRRIEKYITPPEQLNYLTNYLSLLHLDYFVFETREFTYHISVLYRYPCPLITSGLIQ